MVERDLQRSRADRVVTDPHGERLARIEVTLAARERIIETHEGRMDAQEQTLASIQNTLGHIMEGVTGLRAGHERIEIRLGKIEAEALRALHREQGAAEERAKAYRALVTLGGIIGVILAFATSGVTTAWSALMKLFGGGG